MASSLQPIGRAYAGAAGLLSWLQPVVLLLMRLYIGYFLCKSGWNKLAHIDATAEFFRNLGIPMPVVNAYASGIVETVCGALLGVGLVARLAAIPIIVNMLVAYATAHTAELHAIVSNPEKFVKAPPFLYLLTAIIVLAFGPGAISLDALLSRPLGVGQPRTDDKT